VATPTTDEQATWIVPVAVACAILALLLGAGVAVLMWKRKRAASQGTEMVTARAEDNSVRNTSNYGMLPDVSMVSHYADHSAAVSTNSHYDELTPIEAGPVSPP
jgi:hypothetical protein